MSTTTPPKRGRPALPPGAGKLARIELRVSPEVKAIAQRHADAASLPLTQWIERRILSAR